MMRKRSQEEIVGFVLIILLVTVISLVFLAIKIRQPAEKIDSREMASFLQSAMQYSTDCYSNPEIRYDVKDLIVGCYNTEKCLNNKSACSILNGTLSDLLKNSWKPGKDNPIKSYSFRVYGKENNRAIIQLKEGVCLGVKEGSSISIPVYSSILKAEIEVCS